MMCMPMHFCEKGVALGFVFQKKLDNTESEKTQSEKTKSEKTQSEKTKSEIA